MFLFSIACIDLFGINSSDAGRSPYTWVGIVNAFVVSCRCRLWHSYSALAVVGGII